MKTESELREIEEWAALPYSNEELASIISIPYPQLLLELDDRDSPIGMAIKRGRLLAKGELFKKVRTLSNQGSGPAQQMWKQLIRNIQE
jgi:hypothetical protein